MILYKQITYININKTIYKLAEKYTISRPHDVKKHFTFDEFVLYQQKKQFPHISIISHDNIPMSIMLDENQDIYIKKDIYDSIEVGTFTTMTQTDKYTFDELKAMLPVQEFIKCIINIIKEEGVL